jgi:hypothetical protein
MAAQGHRIPPKVREAQAMDASIVVAVVGIAGALIGATLSSWLGGRQSVAQELRDLRVQCYPSVWRRTSVLSRWPRTDARVANLRQLHVDLRTWYYGTGGLSMSSNARRRYEELQTLIEVIASDSETTANDQISTTDYNALMGSASAFRSSLTEDLQTRNQRSLINAVQLNRVHRTQAAEARRRLSGRQDGSASSTLLHHITESDEQLDTPNPPCDRAKTENN